jgi:lauroyl/myristoyl acyltransferase
MIDADRIAMMAPPKPAALLAAKVAAAALVSWVIPERAWDPITRAIGRASVRGNGASTAATIERIAAGHAARLYGLREYRPFRPRPRITLHGTTHLLAALGAGNGAILWVGRFAYASLISKIALHDAGFAVTHLSRVTHGFAPSDFAVRWLNPLWTAIEERYLEERVVMRGNGTAALRTLRRRLAENRIVSISVGDEGVRTTEVPLLDGRLRVATGAVSLALATGARLLPVFTIRTGRAFDVEIGAPLELPTRASCIDTVVRQFADRLTPFVLASPGQWLA